MMLPFQKFVSSFDQEKFDYDIRRFSGPRLREPGTAFSQEQYMILGETGFSLIFSVMAQYHEWLTSEIEKEKKHGGNNSM